MVSVMGGVQKAVSSLNTQLANMTDVLKELTAPGASTSSPPDQPVPEHQQANKETIAPDDRQLPEELRKRLALEQEKTRQVASQIPPHLAPIQVPRHSAPPGFGNNSVFEIHSANGTPTAAYKIARTPGFHGFQPPGVRQSWDDFQKQYDQDMCTQFLKSITKGPRLDFPRFVGDNPSGWFRKCE